MVVVVVVVTSDRERGIEAVKNDEPLGTSGSLASEEVAAGDESVVIVMVREGGAACPTLVNVHGCFLRLGLVDGLEELCVDALGACFLRRAKHAGAQLGVVDLFAACSGAFGHDGLCEGRAEGRVGERRVSDV